MSEQSNEVGVAATVPASPARNPPAAATNVSHPSSSSTSAGGAGSNSGSASTTARKATVASLNDANEELAQLIIAGKISSDDVSATKSILNDYTGLKEKVEKLKSLLGRSAKAQREAKIDLDASQKRLTSAMKEIERLHQKLDKLQTRPSHLDLIHDFETNFDKALLSVSGTSGGNGNGGSGQAGGEDTSAMPSEFDEERMGSSSRLSFSMDGRTSSDANLDSMLMQELGEAKSRIEKLETLNSAMMSRSTQLENAAKTLQKERDDSRDANSRLQMELRMSQMESEQARRAMMDKAKSLEEMQIEIDLVTKASTKASARAAKGQEAANSLKTEKQHIQQLETQVQALREWAMASSEAKQLMQERCRILENKLKIMQSELGRPTGSLSADGNDNGNESEQVLFTKNGSLVIGAGDTGYSVVALGEHGPTVNARFVVLRWKFDSSPGDLTVEFNIMKGKCDTPTLQARADYLIKDRVITGGAGGETEGAFNTDDACTLMWSNAKSWIRPRTVKYTVEVVAFK